MEILCRVLNNLPLKQTSDGYRTENSGSIDTKSTKTRLANKRRVLKNTMYARDIDRLQRSVLSVCYLSLLQYTEKKKKMMVRNVKESCKLLGLI